MANATDFYQTSREAAIANTLASSNAMIDHLNTELRNLYLARFNSWTIGVLAGKTDNSNPPQPPNGYQLTAPNSTGFQFYELGSAPVCAMPAIPDDHSKPQVVVVPEPDRIRNVPPGDTMPLGFIATAPDGARWQKQASPTPFGVAYYYARL